MNLQYRALIVTVLLAFQTCSARLPVSQSSNQEPQLTEEQMQEFLLTAKIVKSKATNKGITGARRLTLSDGKITHDAGFNSIDESKPKIDFPNGTRELNFRDSYKFNLAAYELAKLIGLADMIPATVIRKCEGKTGSLTWWLPVIMDEESRNKNNVTPPDVLAFNSQVYKQFVFSNLVYDTDRNMGNTVYTADWHLWMIDFTRAFRILPDLPTPKDLKKCSRDLLQSLRKLDAKVLEEKTKGLLTPMQVRGIMERRDKIVAHFEKLIAEKGEAEILY